MATFGERVALFRAERDRAAADAVKQAEAVERARLDQVVPYYHALVAFFEPISQAPEFAGIFQPPRIRLESRPEPRVVAMIDSGDRISELLDYDRSDREQLPNPELEAELIIQQVDYGSGEPPRFQAIFHCSREAGVPAAIVDAEISAPEDRRQFLQAVMDVLAKIVVEVDDQVKRHDAPMATSPQGYVGPP